MTNCPHAIGARCDACIEVERLRARVAELEAELRAVTGPREPEVDSSAKCGCGHGIGSHYGMSCPTCGVDCDREAFMVNVRPEHSGRHRGRLTFADLKIGQKFQAWSDEMTGLEGTYWLTYEKVGETSALEYRQDGTPGMTIGTNPADVIESLCP